MRSGTKDWIRGKFHEVKGKVKGKTGQGINHPDLETEGQSGNLAGKSQKKIGQIGDIFKN